MEAIVGVDTRGVRLKGDDNTKTVRALRAQGDVWAEHVLENARAYIMTFIYIVFTVTTGWPLISGVGYAAGVDAEWLIYICRSQVCHQVCYLYF